MNNNNNTQVNSNAPATPIWGRGHTPHPNMEPLVKLFLASRLKDLQESSKKKLKELQDGQEKVSKLHQLNQKIKAAKGSDGTLDITNNPELKDLLAKAKDLGAEITPNKTKFTKEECNDLIDNIKIAADDLNVKNDMNLQTMTHLTNAIYESFQAARSITKPLHEDKYAKARAARGA